MVGSPEVYRLKSGDGAHFDPNRALFPDVVTEEMGYEAGDVLNALHFVYVTYGDPALARPLRLLELGSGTGVGLMAAAARLRPGIAAEIRAIDKYPYCADLTRQNLEAVCGTRHGSQVSITTWEGDWFDDGVWARLGADGWRPDCILFNPPFKLSGEAVRPEFQQAPGDMLYASDEDGIAHYEHVIPRALSLLSNLDGATLLIRRPFYRVEADNSYPRNRRIDDLIAVTERQVGGAFAIGHIRGPVLATPGRIHVPFSHWSTISRGEIGMPPLHRDRLVYHAMSRGLPGVPRTLEKALDLNR